MGLLPGRKRRKAPNPMDEVVRPALRTLPDPATISVDDLARLPFAWPQLDASGRAAVLEGATGAVEAGRSPTQLIESGEPAAIAWGSQLQGTALIATALPGGPEWSAGLQLLVDALHAPYRDVVAMACWQLSVQLNHAGQEFAPAAVGYARLASWLGAPCPLLPLAVDLAMSDEGQPAARSIAQQALATLPPGSVAALQAQQVQAILDMQQQPQDVRDWYLAARTTVAEDLWTRDGSWLAERGHFTTSSGTAAISTRIFAPCAAACYAVYPFRGDDGCGRSPEHLAAIPAPPGMYPVLTLHRPTEIEGQGTAIIALLQDESAERTGPRSPEALAATLARAVPVLLGRLASQGTLYLADAAATYDTRDVIVDIPVLPIQQDPAGGPDAVAPEVVVAAWLAPPVDADGCLQVLAIGACTGPLADAIQSAPAPGNLAHLLPKVPTGASEPGSAAHAQQAAHLNRMLDWDRDRPRALSWTAAAAAAGLPQAAQLLARDRLPFDDEFLDSLQQRGRRTIDSALLARSKDRQAKSLRRPIKATARARVGNRRLARLARHPSPWVRRTVASRPGLPAAIIRILAVDSDEYVRWSVTRQEAVPVEVLVALAQDPSAAIRDAIAAHPRTPPSTRAKIRSQQAIEASARANASAPAAEPISEPTSEPISEPISEPASDSGQPRMPRQAFAQAMARGDRAGALAAVDDLLAEDGDRTAAVVAASQVALTFDLDASEPLVQQLQQWSSDPDADLAQVAQAAWQSRAASGLERADCQERAAQAMLRLEVPELQTPSAALLAEATWQLDGVDAAQHLLGTLVGDDDRAWVPVAAVRARLAASQGDWVAVLEACEPCLQADPALARKVRPDWLRALDAWWDRPAAIKQLTALPENLQGGDTHALLARLQFADDDLAQAASSWDLALSRGWTEFDSAFIQALPQLTLRPQALQALADLPGDRADEVRTQVAGNPRTPASLLEGLAQGSPTQAAAVAANPTCPPDLLTRLARRHEIAIRRAVAANPACPVEVMEQLVGDPDPGVRMAVRDHPRCPDEIRVQASLTL